MQFTSKQYWRDHYKIVHMAAVLSWHVQNFVAMWYPTMEVPAMHANRVLTVRDISRFSVCHSSITALNQSTLLTPRDVWLLPKIARWKTELFIISRDTLPPHPQRPGWGGTGVK